MTKLRKKDNTPKGVLKRKMYTKYVSKGIALSLMHYNSESKLFKSYKNTSYCSEVMIVHNDKKTTSTYCKNRWCLTCNRIKTARLINGYMPEIEKLFQPVFVTVTLPTVLGKELKSRIETMEASWRYIYKKTTKAKFKKAFPYFKGIRKAECTIRPMGKYHYHFHFLMDGWAQGEWFVGEWLKRHPESNTKAQNIRLLDEFGVYEVFKYAVKVETKADYEDNLKNPENMFKDSKKGFKMSAKTKAIRFNEVFEALRGKRTYSAFGGIRMIKEDFEDEDLKNELVLEDSTPGVYKWISEDWFNKATGEALVGLLIPKKVRRMVKYPNNEKEA